MYSGNVSYQDSDNNNNDSLLIAPATTNDENEKTLANNF